MSDYLLAARNLGLKAYRRLTSVHKPFVRAARKRERAVAQRSRRRAVCSLDETLGLRR